jgi:hypothetical protein
MDSKKRADEQVSAGSSGVSHNGRAYKLINLNYDIVIIVRTSRSYSVAILPVLINYIQVDDSTSMQLGTPISRWRECREAISQIAEAALQIDTGGVEVYFLNSPNNRTCKVIYFVILANKLATPTYLIYRRPVQRSKSCSKPCASLVSQPRVGIDRIN